MEATEGTGGCDRFESCAHHQFVICQGRERSGIIEIVHHKEVRDRVTRSIGRQRVVQWHPLVLRSGNRVLVPVSFYRLYAASPAKVNPGGVVGRTFSGLGSVLVHDDKVGAGLSGSKDDGGDGDGDSSSII